MSGPWEQYTQQSAEPGPWQSFEPQQPKTSPYKGAILPFSRDDQGNVSFDSNAGIVGALKRAFTLPGQVYKGEVDPASPEGLARAAEMAGVVSPVNPAVRAGGNAVGAAWTRGTRPANPPAPSRDALYAASDAAYESARNMGVDYSADAVRNMAAGLRQSLERDGILEELAPKAFAVLKKLEQPPEGSVAPLAGLEAARRAFRNAGKDFNNPTDQLAADRLIRGIDEFVAGDVPGSVVSGPASAARAALGEARGNYAAASRSDRLAGVEDRADLRAAAANSGRNLDNTIRQRIADVLLDPRKVAGFSAEERQALEEVVRGTATRNTLRTVGNLFGGGGGLGAVAAGGLAGTQAGGAYGGLVGALLGVGVPATGWTAKSAGNAMTGRSLARVDKMTRKRSPLYDAIRADAPPEVISPEARAALIRVLMQAQQEQPAQ